MYEYDLSEVGRLTGFSAKRRQELSRYYSDLPDKVRIEAHKIQADLIQQNWDKKAKDKDFEFVYAFFLIVLDMMERAETGQSRKTTLTDEELKKIAKIRRERIKADHHKKGAPTKQIIEVRFFELIKKLQGERLSWRDISKYISRFHKKKISHTYLKQCYEEISAGHAKTVSMKELQNDQR